MKLTDFGSAMVQSDSATATLHITPAYASSELQRGRVDRSADVFSYGLVLCELATGQRAFDASLLVICWRGSLVICRRGRWAASVPRLRGS
jgi:serine/threonine protein kinase